MKCAVAVISRVCGTSFRRSRRTVNHAGTRRLTNVTVTVRGVSERTRAFEIGPAQIAVGCGTAENGVSSHGPPLTRSQRRLPITIADGPPWMRYENLFGDSSVKSETSRLRR